MNILVSMLKYPPDFSGAGFRIHRMYRRLKEKGVREVYVITTSLTEARPLRTTYEGIHVHHVGHNPYAERQNRLVGRILKGLFVLRSVGGVLWIFFSLRGRIDLVHSVDSSWLSSLVGWCAFFSRKPLVKEIVLMGSDDPVTLKKEKSFFSGPFFLRPFHFARLVIVVSSALKCACIDYGLDRNRIWTRFNPVYIRLPEDAKRADGPKPRVKGRRRILWVGVIRNRKRIDFLLKAAFFLEGEVDLVFVGPQPERNYFNQMLALAKDLLEATQGRIRTSFLGRVDDNKELADLYQSADLFWFASRYEGSSNAAMEALVCGTPVVTLPIGGVMNEILLDQRSGEVVKTDDPAVFAHCVNKVLQNYPYDRRAISEEAKKRFGPERVENGYLWRFKTILSGRPLEIKSALESEDEGDTGKRPFFSVILPVYNGESFVSRAVESVLRQTFIDWELVIVDDASTDNSWEVCRRYADADERIRLVRNEVNLHISYSSNRGIQIARGRWIARIDADDFYKPDYLEKVHECIHKSDGFDFFVSTWVTAVDEREQKILDLKLPDASKIKRMMKTENFIYHSATAYPKALWREVGGYPEERAKGGDRALWMKFFERSADLVMISEFLVNYRIHYWNVTSVSIMAFGQTKEVDLKDVRRNREWKISLYLKQNMPHEARREINVLLNEQKVTSLKNLFYYILTFLPRPLIHHVMWEWRPRLRRWGQRLKPASDL